jgi:DNA-binding NarL/FixJ family response regulator
MHTIAIIDRHPILRAGLCAFLKDHLQNSRILLAGNPEHFVALYPGQKPDLFILGLNNGPKINNFGSIKELKTKFPVSSLIVYDEKADPALSRLYIKAGASGYLSKQDELEELQTCLRQVMAGRRYICREVIHINVFLNSEAKKKANALSFREYEVASYLSQGMKISWIAKALGIQVSTTSTVKTKIFKKLNIESIVQLEKLLQAQYTQ